MVSIEWRWWDTSKNKYWENSKFDSKYKVYKHILMQKNFI